jgi:hypothetical protein
LSSNCNASVIRSEISGDDNTTLQTLSGGVVQSKISINGSNNTVTHTAGGAGLHNGEITVSGSGQGGGSTNTVSLTQSGVTAKNAIITSTGSTNSISITQTD